MYQISGITNEKPYTNINYRTGELHQTTKYIYNTADIIGKEAKAFVYFGRRKETGEKVAAKVLTSSLSHHCDSFIHQEIEVLSSLNHENIVRFLACETEEGSGLPVVITEYCEDGSLQTQLEKPENMFGLLEDEFLVFLKDLTSALLYMRQKKIIHWDIKAENILRDKGNNGRHAVKVYQIFILIFFAAIRSVYGTSLQEVVMAIKKLWNTITMKYISDRTVYKLSCFGSTRKLADDGMLDNISMGMSSLTVRGENTSQTFDATADLRSIGITIYHAAVGKLPFRPIRGKADTATMDIIISKKPKGAISGVQREENGEIVYSKKFPNTCQLPEALQESIIDVIEGLLDHMLNFEQFFDKASSIHDKIRIRIFHGYMGHDTVIYLDRRNRYADLQEEVARILEIPANNQLLLVLDQELTEIVNGTDEIRTYPKTIIRGIVFLYQPQIIDTRSLGLLDQPDFPDISIEDNLEYDATIARHCASVACHMCRTHAKVLEWQALLSESLSNFREYIERIVRQSKICLPDLERYSVETRRRLFEVFTSLRGFKSITKSFLVLHGPDSREQFKEIKRLLQEIKKLLKEKSFDAFQEKIEERIREIEKYIEILGSKMQEQEDAASVDCEGCRDNDHCQGKMARKKQQILDIMNIFLRHTKYETLHEHEEFIHRAEKQKLADLCVELLSTMQGHCLHNYYSLYESVMKHLVLLTKHLARVRKVEQNVESVKESQKQINIQLGKFEDVFFKKMDDIQSLMNQVLDITESQKATGESSTPQEREFADKITSRSPLDQPLQHEEEHTLQGHRSADGSRP